MAHIYPANVACVLVTHLMTATIVIVNSTYAVGTFTVEHIDEMFAAGLYSQRLVGGISALNYICFIPYYFIVLGVSLLLYMQGFVHTLSTFVAITCEPAINCCHTLIHCIAYYYQINVCFISTAAVMYLFGPSTHHPATAQECQYLANSTSLGRLILPRTMSPNCLTPAWLTLVSSTQR